MQTKFPSILVVMILAIGTLIGVSVVPLSTSHWDSPIYLYQAKRFAETDLLKSYSSHAEEIGSQVSERSWPKNESYSESFWRFMRLGNIAILGSIVKLADDPVIAMNLAGWVYAFFLATATALMFLAVCDLAILFDVPNKKSLTIAAAASSLLYFASPIFWYLSGNFVSEIPALLLLSATLFAFLRAVLLQSIGFAVLAGGLVFLLYTVRMDSAWSAIAILVPLIIATRLRAKHQFPYWLMLIACITALLSFFVYSFFFFPLTDPGLVLALRQVLGEGRSGVANGVPGYYAVFVAGGLLWIGAAWALLSRRLPLLTTIGIIWVVLIVLPRAGSLLSGPLHSRMLADLMIPLVLLSSVGLSGFFSSYSLRNGVKASRGIVVVAIVFALAISIPASYDWLKTFPGLWRLQYARTFLVPPQYERNNYPTQELQQIATNIYGGEQNTIVLWDPEIPQEFLNIVRYFGPKYPTSADLSMEPDPTNKQICNKESLNNDWKVEPAIFCSVIEKGFLKHAEVEAKRIIALMPTKQEGNMFSMLSSLKYDSKIIVEGDLITAVALRNSQ